MKSSGGAIGSTGCTGYGMGYEGDPISLSAELEVNFFYQIGNGATHLAQAHSQAIQKFLAEEEINKPADHASKNHPIGQNSHKLPGG